MENLTGKQLGQYRIVSPLGEGGMAAVYKAYQPSMERYVALKILPRHLASDPEFHGRFEQEAKVVAKLQHVYILPVHDFGEEDGYAFIVMPYIETGTLSGVLQGEPLPLWRIWEVISQVGQALDYAHERGVVHRDIKPSNILIDETGNCLLTDFGIAKMIEGSVQFTRTGAIVGTPAYMSPEQIRGDSLDGRSDEYSLGIVLYEMATGRPPFRAETPPAIFVKHLHDPLPLPRDLNEDLPESLELVIVKCLAKDPAGRYRSMHQVVEALSKAMPGGPPIPMPTGSDDLVQAATLRGTGEDELSEAADGLRMRALPKEASSTSSDAGGSGEAQVLGGFPNMGGHPAPVDGTLDRRSARRLMWLGGAVVVAFIILFAAAVTGALLIARGEVVGQTALPTPTQRVTAAHRTATTASVILRSTATPLPMATEVPEASVQSWRQGRIVFSGRMNGTLAIYEMDLTAGASPRIIANPGRNEAFRGSSLSPDADRVAYYIYGARAEILSISGGEVVRTAEDCNSPTWAPDGTRLICGTHSGGGSRFLLVDASTGSRLSLLDPGVSGAVIPAWSPDASELVFAALGQQGSAVWRSDSNGQGAVLLTAGTGEHYAPSWSPDGSRIAFQSSAENETSQIWIMDRQGGNKRQVTHSTDGWSAAPAWSPDGRWLAFVSSQAGSIGADYGEIFVLSLDTGELAQLTSTGGQIYDWRVSWGS